MREQAAGPPWPPHADACHGAGAGAVRRGIVVGQSHGMLPLQGQPRNLRRLDSSGAYRALQDGTVGPSASSAWPRANDGNAIGSLVVSGRRHAGDASGIGNHERPASRAPAVSRTTSAGVVRIGTLSVFAANGAHGPSSNPMSLRFAARKKRRRRLPGVVRSDAALDGRLRTASWSG